MMMTKKEWLLEEFDCSYHALYDRVAPLMRLKKIHLLERLK
jgi:hypothetical protein